MSELLGMTTRLRILGRLDFLEAQLFVEFHHLRTLRLKGYKATFDLSLVVVGSFELPRGPISEN